jgi:hypothetical protein
LPIYIDELDDQYHKLKMPVQTLAQSRPEMVRANHVLNAMPPASVALFLSSA